MPYIARTNTTCTYNSNALTAYCNQADLSATLDVLDGTSLSSTGKVNIPDTTNWEISLAGLWDPTLDGYLSADAITPGTLRTTVITYANGSTVTYTWTASGSTVGGAVSNFQIQAAPGNLITWSATLTLSGAPVRTVA